MNILSCTRLAMSIGVFAILMAASSEGQVIVTNDPPSYGPYNGSFLRDGAGLKKPLLAKDTLLRPDLPWSMYGWVNASEVSQALMLIGGIGEPTEVNPRYLAMENGRVAFWMGRDNALGTSTTLQAGKWQFLAVTFDGATFQIYVNGAEAGGGKLMLGTSSAVLQMAPAKMPETPETNSSASRPKRPPLAWEHFGGKIAGFTVVRHALRLEEIKQLQSPQPDFSLVIFEEGSKPWPFQTRQQVGYRAPQDPSTMPKSKAAFSRPIARPVSNPSPALQPNGTNQWTLAGGWKLAPAPGISADGSKLSGPGIDEKQWWAATMPGTVLTTMIDRGVYPDSDYGLNNLAIPESLNKQDYWYRNEFKAPNLGSGHHLTLTFEGVNYKAAVWLNGQLLGTITGAFIRGVFDVTNVLKPGANNVLAVRVSPPPHPGIPHEQSLLGGAGENGGAMCIDGPTFVASEGWDWVPAIRDRNTGIWQPVTLRATANVKIGDPQVVTSLPLPDTSRAEVEITVPLENKSDKSVHGTLVAEFENVSVTKEITLAAGKSDVKLAPAEFSQLVVQSPRLWWPNGYGKPEMYRLRLTFTEGKQQSDVRDLRFGIREVTYELSLFDSSGRLRRVEYSPTRARVAAERVVDILHEGTREIPATDAPPPDWPPEWREGWKSWVASLTPEGEKSNSIRAVQEAGTAPFMVIKVNGVRIAARGGNWGMDDSRKRVSRERLEPYFRLHRDANVNIIRNWVGQNTEETFFELADEYGLMVWNDFWDSTHNYNAEIQDPALFLDNVRDTVLRFRNHPSIVVWCGRNEGVPQPILNEGLDEVLRSFDGTRYYSPSSNQVNLQNSGPYKYQDPTLYYTNLNHGFSVETGTPSFSTLESFRAWIPKEDLWPISDNWAYHDWHQGGNGDMAPFMTEIETEFGAAIGLEDFERKAQMLNYVDHRAIFEGMNAHLWNPNSGRMLWMTQPAWPSNTWQILSSDYDTQASFYGVKKACEPVHVQLDLSNYNVDAVNTTRNAVTGTVVSARVFSLDSRTLLSRDQHLDLAANSMANAMKLELGSLFASGVVIVKLELKSSTGELLSENLYWLGEESQSYRQLNRLSPITLAASATSSRAEQMNRIRVQLKNDGTSVALMTKLTLVNAGDGVRILPAYYSDNYMSLLPGEVKTVLIEYPESANRGAAQVMLRGWNVAAATVAVGAK